MTTYTEDELKILSIGSEEIPIIYAKSALLVAKWFEGKLDKGGAPYANHLYFVASKVDDDIERICALLHDLIEDTPVTFEDLENFGFPDEILEILRLLTRETDVSYDEYIDNLIASGNLKALHIKKRDMENNMDPSRLADEYLIEKLKNKYEIKIKLIEEAIRRKENEQ